MESKESIDLNLARYLLAIRRHWIPALAIFTATTVLGIVAASLLKPSYQAEGRLLFKNSAFKVVGSNLVPSSIEGGESGDLKPLVATQNPISTQMEVISSRPILQKVIERLNLKNDKGKPVEPIELQTALTAKILGGSDILQLNYKSRKPQEAASIVNMLMNVYLESDILASRNEAEVALQFMEKQLPKTRAAIEQAEASLRQFKQQNNVVDLSEEAKSAVAITGNLGTAIDTVRAELEQVNAQNRNLQQKINLTSQQAIVVSTIAQSTEIQGLLAQLQDVDKQLATERSRFSESNPLIINLKQKQTQLTNLLEQKIQSTVGDRAKVPQGLLRIGELKQSLIKDLLQSELQRIGLTKKITSLQNSRTAYEKRVSVIPQLVQNQRHLERQVEVAQSTHQGLSKKIQELQLAKNKNISPARIVSSAIVPKVPDLTNKILVGTLGAILGAFFGTSAIAYLELKDKSLKTVKDIEQLFGYTLLGTIPANKLHQKRRRNLQPGVTTLEVAVRDTPQSLTSEMSRTIQSNLRFLSENNVLKTIVVTSSVANEGKSKVAANLAAAIAGMGQKVLLVDADMRVPYQHQFWKLPLKKGLSELLLAKKSKFPQISWTVMENLDVLTAGSKTVNPLSCVESKQMQLFLQDAATAYDFIIIDTPPILVASEALVLGKLSDGILLVSRPGVLEPERARAAKEKLTMSNSHVLGSIVNGVIQQNETEDYFAATAEYFSDESDPEAPWTDYMTQLGETIADRSRQSTQFTDESNATTMLGKLN